MSGATPIKVLANASTLIETLGAEGPQTPAEIAARIGIPRSSVYRLVEGLEAIAMVETLEDTRVRLSARWLHLADSARTSMGEWSETGQVLEGLVATTGLTAYLSVRRGGRAVCVDWRQGRGIALMSLKPGLSLPLNAGAAGRVLLAFGDHEGVLDDPAMRPALTDLTIVDREELAADIELTRSRGFVLSEEDVTKGIGALGMPVHDRRGQLRGAISLAGIVAEIRAEQNELLDELRAAIAAVSASLAVAE
ncbi:IclR family transcriptional regulator [Microbacterium sp. NPDC078428]|uniref:IclR family transcriptional regulator n=1 Tax=Microbacterium sp. NPDC078428 TaxID=3364190 RepID=UPI0037CB90DE